MESISKRLLDFQLSVETIKKDGQNTFFKKQNGKASTYATLPNILAEVKPILNKLNLVLTQPIINGEVLSVITCVETNEYVQSGIVLPTGLNAQQIGSAITYFRRYTLSSLLSLEIDEDDDGNMASGKKETPKEAPKVDYSAHIESLQKATTLLELKAIYEGLSKELQKVPEIVAAKDLLKSKLK